VHANRDSELLAAAAQNTVFGIRRNSI